MPSYKPQLSKREQAQYLRVAQELAAAGVRLDIPPEWHEAACSLRILIGGPPESLIYQLSSRIVLYAVRVNLLAERGGLIVRDFEIRPSWDPDVFPCYPKGRTAYQFAPGLDFDWTEVLNHRIENFLRFRRGDMREGWLLAMGNKPVPDEYGPGRPAPLDIVLVDQFSNHHAASAEFVVERSAKSTRSVLRPRTSLFAPEGKPDGKHHVTGEASRLPRLTGPSVSGCCMQPGDKEVLK